MTVTCEICGKEFKNSQGLRGHKTFVHQMTTTHDPPARLATEQELDQLTTRLEKLESITGLKEPSSLDRLLGTDKPITEQLERHTRRLTELSEQLSKLTEQLKSEYVSKEALGTIAAELTRESESLHKEIVNTYNMSAIAIRESRESCENSFSKTEGQSTATANELYELSKTVKHVQESVQGNRASINQLNTKLVSLEHASSELDNKIARVKNLTRRVPTGEIVSVQLNDKREHHFREYKSKAGLARPHRTSRDLIFGDRWIDLAEPED